MSLVLAIVDAWRPLSSRLQEVADFGTNPGALRMLTYAPDHLPSRPALVVALHGSTQSAAKYDLGAGWSTLADQHGFVLLMPEQGRNNNPNCSFNWFLPGDITRDEGEACSIAQMVEKAVLDFNIDRKRIFIAGLSAGGAMTLAMLATYPDLFAAGAVVAGLPYGGATNLQEALRGMFQDSDRSSRELGDLVRAAAPATTHWPRLSVWHGSADRTVKPSNAGEIVKQWLDLHGLPAAPMSEQIIDGHPRQVWWNADGETVIEFLQHCRHGAWRSAVAHRSRRPRSLHDRDRHFLVGPHCAVFRIDRHAVRDACDQAKHAAVRRPEESHAPPSHSRGARLADRENETWQGCWALSGAGRRRLFCDDDGVGRRRSPHQRNAARRIRISLGSSRLLCRMQMV